MLFPEIKFIKGDQVKGRTLLLTLILLAGAASHASAQRLSVSVNAAEAALLSPNIEFGIVTGGQTSLHFDICYTDKPYDLSIKLLSVGTEFKCWLSKSPLNRLYVGGRLQYSNYDYYRDDSGHYGDALILGPTVGYDFLLGKRWVLELSTGYGAALYNEQYYDTVTPLTTKHDISFVPVKLNISIIFIIS